jgi:hypothetical protein
MHQVHWNGAVYLPVLSALSAPLVVPCVSCLVCADAVQLVMYLNLDLTHHKQDLHVAEFTCALLVVACALKVVFAICAAANSWSCTQP